ncbi:MAG TPA: hypothetical protein VHZ02_13620 [Acidimicrobiales bacterium]|nr:hypothetical protein [Acidimicrobiales bacterium]
METWAGRWVATGGDTAGVVDEEPEEPEPDEDPVDPEPDEPEPDEPEPDEDPVAGVVVVVVPWVAAFALCPGSALLK